MIRAEKWVAMVTFFFSGLPSFGRKVATALLIACRKSVRLPPINFSHRANSNGRWHGQWDYGDMAIQSFSDRKFDLLLQHHPRRPELQLDNMIVWQLENTVGWHVLAEGDVWMAFLASPKRRKRERAHMREKEIEKRCEISLRDLAGVPLGTYWLDLLFYILNLD